MSVPALRSLKLRQTAEARPGHADDLERMIAVPEDASDHVRIFVKRSAPERLADHHDRWRVRHIVRRGQRSSEAHARPQHVEVGAGYRFSRLISRYSINIQRMRRPGGRCQGRERCLLRAQIGVIRSRQHRAPAHGAVLIAPSEHHDLRLVRHARRWPERRLNQRVHGGRRPDAGGERCNRKQREERRMEKAACAQTQITSDCAGQTAHRNLLQSIGDLRSGTNLVNSYIT